MAYEKINLTVQPFFNTLSKWSTTSTLEKGREEKKDVWANIWGMQVFSDAFFENIVIWKRPKYKMKIFFYTISEYLFTF